MEAWNPLGLRDQRIIRDGNKWLTAVYESAQVPLSQASRHAIKILKALHFNVDITPMRLATLLYSEEKKLLATKLLFLHQCINNTSNKNQLLQLFTIILSLIGQEAGDILHYERTHSNFDNLLRILMQALNHDVIILSMTATIYPLLSKNFRFHKNELGRIEDIVKKGIKEHPKLLVFDTPWKDEASLFDSQQQIV